MIPLAVDVDEVMDVPWSRLGSGRSRGGSTSIIRYSTAQYGTAAYTENVIIFHNVCGRGEESYWEYS